MTSIMNIDKALGANGEENMAYRTIRLASILMAAMLIGAPAYAATYKWVDKNGKVHYSQTPPADGQFETIRDPHPVKEAPAAPADQQKNPETAPAAQAPAADQESPQEACSKAKERLAALENNAGRLVVKQSDGTMHQLSEEERQSYIKDTTAQIAAVCK